MFTSFGVYAQAGAMGTGISRSFLQWIRNGMSSKSVEGLARGKESLNDLSYQTVRGTSKFSRVSAPLAAANFEDIMK